MKKRDWIYLINPFDVATNKSDRAMKKIAGHTLAALKARRDDSFFNDLYNKLLPVYNQFVNQYEGRISKVANQVSKTSRLANQLALLRSKKIREWDHAIQNVYDEDSVMYKAFFPNYRRPFQQGSQLDRITAVRALEGLVMKDGTLPTSLKNDITVFANALELDQQLQSGGKSGTKGANEELEIARTALAETLFSILGSLIAQYPGNRQMIAIFFDLTSLRRFEQKQYKRKLKPGAMLCIFKHSFEAEDRLLLNNNGDTELCFYLANTPMAAPGEHFVNVPPHTELEVTATDLGDITFNQLMVMNKSEAAAGRCTVTL